MATVYLATQESLDREVALKVMAVALAADRSFSERFLFEARTAAKLQHPGIVAVHDMGASGNCHYIAMEYVDGGDLKQRLRGGSLSGIQALEILRKIASALDYAHSKGFVHRDIKPENILFRRDGQPIITDFGIARAVDSTSHMTATGMSIGTPYYMSPEQARGRSVDVRTDLYAMGIVFYEMLTGNIPYDAQDSFAVGLMHINDPVPQLPDELFQWQPILDRLLAKDPRDRYHSGADLIQDIDQFKEAGRAGQESNRTTRALKQPSAQAAQPLLVDSGRVPKYGYRRSVRWAVTGSCLGLIAIAVLVYFAGMVSGPEQRRPGGGSPSFSSTSPPVHNREIDGRGVRESEGIRFGVQGMDYMMQDCNYAVDRIRAAEAANSHDDLNRAIALVKSAVNGQPVHGSCRNAEELARLILNIGAKLVHEIEAMTQLESTLEQARRRVESDLVRLVQLEQLAALSDDKEGAEKARAAKDNAETSMNNISQRIIRTSRYKQNLESDKLFMQSLLSGFMRDPGFDLLRIRHVVERVPEMESLAVQLESFVSGSRKTMPHDG